MRIFFDLSGQEPWHRREWERLLGSIASGSVPSATTAMVDRPDLADCIVCPAPSKSESQGVPAPARVSAHAAGTASVLVWDSGDHPDGRAAGLYCSLPKSLFDPRRHRSFCYPIRYNECVRPTDLGDVRYLYGFMGGITSGLRGRLVQILQRNGNSKDMLLTVQGGPWARMFDRSGLPAKQAYAEALRRCRFFLCPRGNGVGSVRLFETMEAARVPVIISDGYVLPANIDWEACAIQVREKDLSRIPALLAARQDDWTRLATNARSAWEEHFSEPRLLGELGAALERLDTSRDYVGLQMVRIGLHRSTTGLRRVLGRMESRARGFLIDTAAGGPREPKSRDQ